MSKSQRSALVMLVLGCAAGPLWADPAVDAVFASQAAPGRPGCALAVTHAGAQVYAKAYGQANLEHGVPIDADATVFDIASMTKQFTAAAVLLLAADGRLALTDDVRRYLPEVPDFGHPITLDHLLHHTSGLHDYEGMRVIGDRRASDYTDNADVMDFVRRQQALDFVPGTEYSYSNTGYFLLARVVERVSGMEYGAFLQRRIFAPLGMRHTRVLAGPGELLPHRASGYRPRSGAYVNAFTGWVENGARGVYTTVTDLARWTANLDRGTVGGTALLAGLQERGQLDDGTRIDYARGLRFGSYRGLEMVEHGGADQGYRAQLLRFPGQQLSVLVLCNDMGADAQRLAEGVADHYLSDRLAATPLPPTPTEDAGATAAGLAGTYWSRERGLLRQVSLEHGRLWYVRSSRSRSPLRLVAPGRYRLDGASDAAELVFGTAGSSPRARLIARGDKPIVFERVDTPVPADLAAYTGAYASAEFDTRWLIGLEGGALTVRGWRDPAAEARALRPIAPDVFATTSTILRFERDAAGRIAGLKVDTARARNLVFVRTAG